MRERTLDEAISYFNTKVSEMDIPTKYKMELLGMVAAIGYKAQQPEPQWISCNDTVDLPEHEVLCCDRYGAMLIGWLLCSDDQWLCESDNEMMYDPVAWMPLPESYRGKQDETDRLR